MPVIYDDSFFDDLGASLPAPSVKYLNRAASWSARNSKSGFVPSWMDAELSDDPERDRGPLLAKGVMRRTKGGTRIAEGIGITIVNADDAAADAERKREQGRVRAKRKRDRDKAARAEVMAETVTRDARVTSRSPARGVTRAEDTEPENPQAKRKNVTRYEAGTSRVTPSSDTDRSRSHLSTPKQSKSKSTRAREPEPPPYSPEFRVQVAAEMAARGVNGITDAVADLITADVLGKSKKPVTHPLLFVRTAIANDPDPRGRWVPVQAAPPPPKPGRPEWCGECGEIDRRIEVTEDGKLRLKHCPKCSGQAPAWENAS